MTIVDWGEYFGPSDARAESPEDIWSYFYETDVLGKMKIDQRDSGVSIVVGVKGSGKTALCKIIEFMKREVALVWTIDKTYSFDSTRAGRDHAGIEGLLITLLMTGVLEQIQKHRSEFKRNTQRTIRKTLSTVRDRLGELVKATEIGYGQIRLRVDFDKISADHVDRFSRIPLQRYKQDLEPYLEEKTAYILMDDVDEVFRGFDSNLPFIEGLIEAVNTINLEFGPLLHCILFLRSGPYWSYRTRARGYDKTRRIIGAITWTQGELAELLARRIRHKHGLTVVEPPWKTWAREFSPRRRPDIDRIQRYVLSRCPRGPRDVIDFCNLVRKEVPEGKMTIEDICTLEPKYSAEQLANLNRDFGTEYPDIGRVLGSVFSGERSIWSGEELYRLVNDKICGSTELRDRFGKPYYLRTTHPAEFIRLMYDIGFIGYRKHDSPEFIYAMTDPEPEIEVASAFQHSIHPAYKSHLRLQ